MAKAERVGCAIADQTSRRTARQATGRPGAHPTVMPFPIGLHHSPAVLVGHAARWRAAALDVRLLTSNVPPVDGPIGGVERMRIGAEVYLGAMVSLIGGSLLSSPAPASAVRLP